MKRGRDDGGKEECGREGEEERGIMVGGMVKEKDGRTGRRMDRRKSMEGRWKV